MGSMKFEPRGAGPGPYPNVLDIPTPTLQGVALFIMFVFPAISTVVFGLRIYTRITMRTLGIGTAPTQGRCIDEHDALSRASFYGRSLADLRFKMIISVAWHW